MTNHPRSPRRMSVNKMFDKIQGVLDDVDHWPPVLSDEDNGRLQFTLEGERIIKKLLREFREGTDSAAHTVSAASKRWKFDETTNCVEKLASLVKTRG